MSRTTIFSDTDLSAGSAAVPHRRHLAASAEPHWLQNLRPSRLSARRTLRTAPVTSLVTKSPQYPDEAQLSARPAICGRNVLVHHPCVVKDPWKAWSQSGAVET
jgi:hypothetical protein